jgi:dihydrofolate reductase
MKLTSTTMVSVDGVMQGLGAADEDRRGGFERGGWAMPLFDEGAAAILGGIYARADAFLFGRRTYEVFADSWGAMKEIPFDNPVAVALNTRPKYVASNTLADPTWAKTTVLSGDIEAAVRGLKAMPGGELQVHGGTKFIRWLLDNDLVDEINLITFPLILGQGARLFPEAGPDKALKLIESRSTPRGLSLHVYRPNGCPQYQMATFQSTEVKKYTPGHLSPD